jgi:hypothetical protein
MNTGFRNDPRRLADRTIRMGMWANQAGSQRLSPNVGGPSPSYIQRILRSGNYCEKFIIAVQNNDIPAQEGLISALAQALGITKTQAADILKRECVRRPSPEDTERWCKRYLAALNANDQAMIDTLVVNFATTYGTSKAFAISWFKRNCKPTNFGTIDWTDWCKQYLAYMGDNNMQAVANLFFQFQAQYNVPNMGTVADLFMRNCGHPVVPPGPDTETETETAEDCRITCYKCQNGNNVAMKFDPIKSSKANGRGYNYDCPTGWVNNPTPCKTIANGNNNTTITPIRDVDNNTTTSSNGSSNNTTITPIRDTDFGTNTSSNGSSNNNTILPIRDTNNANSSSSSSSGTNFGTATPNRGLFFSGGI